MNTAGKKVISINRFRAGAYDGASTSSRAQTWGTSTHGPNSGLVSALNGLRSRSRSIYRNAPYIKKALNQLTTDEIGSGIIPRSLSGNNTALDAYWKTVSDNIDPEGLVNFSSMLAQIAIGRRLGGEIFIRKRVRRGASAASPLQLQVLESEYCPEDMCETRPNGNTVKAGIEFNRSGQRVAYFFYTDHPADGLYSRSATSFTRKRVRIPARDVIHHYRPTRAGQLRGEPDVTQVLVKINTLEKYIDAELLRKESKSSYSGAVTRDPQVFENEDDENTVAQGSMAVTPSSFVELLAGENIELFEGDAAGQGFDLFMNEILRSIAAGLEIPFELMTGNYAAINDRLLRGVMDTYHRRIEMDQHLMISQVCTTVWRWSLEAGLLTGATGAYTDDDLDVQWSPQAWPYINPVQDVQARVAEIEAGLKSRQQAVGERGGDVEKVDEQRAEDQKREKALGIEKIEPPVGGMAPNKEPKDPSDNQPANRKPK